MIELIQTDRELKRADKDFKILFLLFLASFFDLEEYLIVYKFIYRMSSHPSHKLFCLFIFYLRI